MTHFSSVPAVMKFLAQIVIGFLFLLSLSQGVVGLKGSITRHNQRPSSSPPLRAFPFGKTTNKTTKVDPQKTVTIDGDYRLAAGCGVTAALALSQQNLFAGVPLSALTALLAVQTGRVKFVFDDEAMEVFVKKNDEELASRENFAVGGQNRWKYSTFLKWSFIPTKEFPIFMYFTESQTDPSKEGGQFHLFPVIMNGGQLYDQLVKRVGLK